VPTHHSPPRAAPRPSLTLSSPTHSLFKAKGGKARSRSKRHRPSPSSRTRDLELADRHAPSSGCRETLNGSQSVEQRHDDFQSAPRGCGETGGLELRTSSPNTTRAGHKTIPLAFPLRRAGYKRSPPRQAQLEQGDEIVQRIADSIKLKLRTSW